MLGFRGSEQSASGPLGVRVNYPRCRTPKLENAFRTTPLTVGRPDLCLLLSGQSDREQIASKLANPITAPCRLISVL